MNVLEKIEALAEQCELEGKYYLIGLDADGSYCGEVDGYNHYCYNCAEKKAKELNEELQRDGYEAFRKNHDCWDGVASIQFNEENSPEDDDFICCDTCGCELNTGVLFTYDDELRCWIDADIDIDKLTPQSAYRINECLTNQEAQDRWPKLVKKLRNKLLAL